MEWYDNYNIGVDNIDKQHRELVDTITRLQTSLSNGRRREEFGNTLKFLVDYAKNHFSAEEELMTAIAYLELDNHKKLHNKFIDYVTSILLNLKKGKVIDSLDLIDFLSDWLRNHIVYEDKKIGKALEAYSGVKKVQ